MKKSRSRAKNGRKRSRDEHEAIQSDTEDKSHPARALQRRVGNQVLQRLASGRSGKKHNKFHINGTGPVNTNGRVEGSPEGSSGRTLSGGLRRTMEQALGTDFGDVRIHDGVEAIAATRMLGVDAYATESDIVLGTGDVSGDAQRTRLLLAHELAHVAQFNQAEEYGDNEVTHRNEQAEREAAKAASRVVRGESTTVRETPEAPIAAAVMDWLEELWSEDDDAMSTAGERVGTDTTTSSDGPHANERKDEGIVKGIGRSFEQGIDEKQDALADKVWSAAETVEGVPIVEEAAKGGAGIVDVSSGIAAGGAQGATTMLTDLGTMVEKPVETARGFNRLYQTFSDPGAPTIPLGGDSHSPRRGGGRIPAISPASDPRSTFQQIDQFQRAMWETIKSDYERSIGEDNDYAQAFGRGLFDIGSLLSSAGSGGAVKGGATASRLANSTRASRAARATQTARTASRVDDAVRISGRSADDVQARITMAGDDTMTTQRAMEMDQGRVTAGSDEGQLVRRTKHGWRNPQGQFAEGPYSLSGGQSASRATARRQLKRQSIDDPKLPSYIRGWYKNQRNQKGSGYWQNYPGHEAGHPLSKPFATHGNKGQVTWELAIDNQARSQLAKLQKRLENEIGYTWSDLLEDAEDINFAGKKPNLPSYE